MSLNYEDMLNYVNHVLIQNGGIKSKKPQLGFRNRFEHIKRVFEWSKRIIPAVSCDEELVLTAAIFHDSGYSNKEIGNHNIEGAEIFKDYASKSGFNQEFTQKVTEMIQLHSNKELLNEKKTPIELVLLMEADLLDEEGALGLVFDLLAEGYKSPESYNSVFNEIMIHSAHILSQDYMVTPLARKYWNEKKLLIEKFIHHLRFDLLMENSYEG